MTIEKEKEALKALKDFSEKNPIEFDEIIRYLANDGFVTDIDTVSFNTRTVEYWSTDCSDFTKKSMEERGYEGFETYAYTKYYGESTPGGKYKEESSFFYILYDSELYEGDEDHKMKAAQKFLDSKADDWFKNTSRN